MAKAKKPVRVLIVGTGGMANSHASAYRAMPGVTVVAGVDTKAEALFEFKATHDVEHGFGTIDEALNWGQFDAVSNVTPDGVHHVTTLPFLAAGKHVLCEKPLATNHADALAMANAAEAAGVINMVNLTYRNVPAMRKAAELVAEGAIGPVRHFEASYLQSWLTQPAWGDWKTEDQWLWRLSRAHGSKGVLGDVGVHILDFATFVAGSMPTSLSCRLRTYPKVEDNQIGNYVLDANDSFAMHAELGNTAIGTINATRFASGHLNDLKLRIYGTEGGLEVLYQDNKTMLSGCLGDARVDTAWSRIRAPKVATVYERFVAAIRGEGTPDPTFARGAALQQVLDLAETGGGEVPV